MAIREDVHERGALDRSQQNRPANSRPPCLIRHPGLRWDAGLRRRTGIRTRRPARHASIRPETGVPPTLTRIPPAVPYVRPSITGTRPRCSGWLRSRSALRLGADVLRQPSGLGGFQSAGDVRRTTCVVETGPRETRRRSPASFRSQRSPPRPRRPAPEGIAGQRRSRRLPSPSR